MTATSEVALYNYLRALRDNLRDISEAEREDIVREINAHVRERMEEPNNTVDQVLRRLGSAEELAAEYRREVLVRKASGSISPLVLLKAALLLATRGVKSFLILLGAFIGYMTGAAFIATAILKPIFPRQTGLWIGPGVFDFGFHEPVRYDPIHEVLGWGYIPVALLIGSLFLWLTTVGIRKWLRRYRRAEIDVNRSGPQAAHAA